MCFSSEASFTAGAICSAVGIASIIKSDKKNLMMAALPLLFGIHQFIEGFVWMYRGEDIGCNSGLLFAYIAFCFWPVYIPLAAIVAETKGIRRNVILGLLPFGIYLSGYAVNVLQAPLTIDFASHHIQYLPTASSPKILEDIYAIVVLVPLWLMRSIYIKLFGVLVLVFFLLSSIYFNPARFSVWCFFASISSILIYKAVSSRQVWGNT